jgi:hypothetical protein
VIAEEAVPEDCTGKREQAVLVVADIISSHNKVSIGKE